MIFYNGIYFALWIGDEHQQLCFNSSQIEHVEKSEERPFLKYVEDVSKNRPGGIKRRKIKPKIVYHHANTTRPERCFVRLYKKYKEFCPLRLNPMHSTYSHQEILPIHVGLTNKPSRRADCNGNCRSHVLGGC